MTTGHHGMSVRVQSATSGGMIDPRGVFRVGIAGPVGSGKTAAVLALCQALREEVSMAVVTNDI